MNLHGLAGHLEALVAEAADGAFWRGNDSVDEGEGHLKLDLVASQKDVDDFGRVDSLEVVVDLLAGVLRLDLELPAVLGQDSGPGDKLCLRASQSSGAVSAQNFQLSLLDGRQMDGTDSQLLIDAALEVADLDPQSRNGARLKAPAVKLKDTGDVNVALVDDRGPAQSKAQTLVEGVDVPEEDTLELGHGWRVVLESLGTVIASSLAQLGPHAAKVPGH